MTNHELNCEYSHTAENSELRKLLEKLDAYTIAGKTYIKIVMQAEDENGIMRDGEVLGPWATEEEAAEYLQNCDFVRFTRGEEKLK